MASVGDVLRRVTRPFVRLWESDDPLDAYALVHLASAAGDALVAVSLADSVFFSLPVGQARTHVALYLAITMAPFAPSHELLRTFHPLPYLPADRTPRPAVSWETLTRSTATVACDSPPSLSLKNATCLSPGLDSLIVHETSVPSFCTV